MAHARFPLQAGKNFGGNARACDTTTIRVWSPMVKEPKAVRYGWATSPLGNLKVGGRQWLPLHSFRTDSWDYPEVDDPATIAKFDSKPLKAEAVATTLDRRLKEGQMARETIAKLEALGAPAAKDEK
jgi:hypothetical protein